MTSNSQLTPDGCPIELYTRLPAGRTPKFIHDAITAGANILELGAGAGRITLPLIELGHEVVAVDESADMLAHIKNSPTVNTRIEDLALDRRFDVVLLMSHLIEKPDIEQSRAFLRACRKHVADHGQVLIQRDTPDWDYRAEPTFTRTGVGGCSITLHDLSVSPSGVLTFNLDYQVDGSTWSQTVVTRPMDDETLVHELALADLELDSFITSDRSWIRARPRVKATIRS
jgi:SAM-dependent methyltransferase